jgi:hypothetical protein
VRHLQTQTDIITLWTETTLMAFEAQMIIAMRVGGMAGFWNVTKAENNRMGTEKLAAVQASAFAAAAAIMLGANPAGIALAAIKPVRRKTTANVRRLGKRGLKFSPSSLSAER